MERQNPITICMGWDQLMRLDQVAKLLSCELEGDGSIEIHGVATLEQAGDGDLSFLTNPKYYNEAKRTKAAAIIADFNSENFSVPILRNTNPYLVFAKAVELFYSTPPQPASIHPTAWVEDSAKLGKAVSIGAYTYIGENVILEDLVEIKAHCTIYHNAVVGSQTIIHSGAVIRERVKIGRRCIIQNNAVIGSDGFGYAKQEDGRWYKILQAGTVIIHDDVEIGAGTTIDRATIGETRIEQGAKLDNLVQIGHGSSVGRDSLICAQVGLAGSTKVGNEVVLAGQVGSAGHLKIGDRVIATGQTGIPGDVEPGSVISGSPAIDNKRWLKSIAVFSKLPDIIRAVRDLEKRVKLIEQVNQVIPEQDKVKLLI
jgi:UDP-3-O-[3-hydroxymyristoyl] glucosamine N-acyltransferase